MCDRAIGGNEGEREEGRAGLERILINEAKLDAEHFGGKWKAAIPENITEHFLASHFGTFVHRKRQ